MENSVLWKIVYKSGVPDVFSKFIFKQMFGCKSENKQQIIAAVNSSSASSRLDMAWYEISRDIFLMQFHAQATAATPSKSVKEPLFTTFSRTFDELAFQPSYWFGRAPDSPQEDASNCLLAAFERFMYHPEGGNCWHALDWASDKYIFRVVCERPRGMSVEQHHESARRYLASLLLASHAIAGRKLNLYISERAKEVSLPYAGISFRSDGSGLLKYWHYDRYTRFSHIRGIELKLDADSGASYPMLEYQWHDLAAAAQAIIDGKAARATGTACARVGVDAILKVMYKLKKENALGLDQSLANDIKTIMELLDSDAFADMTDDELLKALDMDAQLVSPDDMLAACGITSAEDFWDKAKEHCKQLEHEYMSMSERSYPKSVFGQSMSELSLAADARFILAHLRGKTMKEAQVWIPRTRMREAVKSLLLTESMEISSRQLCEMYRGRWTTNTPIRLFDPLQLGDDSTAQPEVFELPDSAMVSPDEDASETLQQWAVELLAAFEGKAYGGRYQNVLDAAEATAAKLWNRYVSTDKVIQNIVQDRYQLSLIDAIDCLDSTMKKTKALLESLIQERSNTEHYKKEQIMDRLGRVKDDRNKCFSIDTIDSVEQRKLVIQNLAAQLMSATAASENDLQIWQNPVLLNTVTTHILLATTPDLNLIFPFHLGVYSDTKLRLTRTYDDQRDHLTRLLEHRYDHAGERYWFLIALQAALPAESDKRAGILDAIIGNPTLTAFASKKRFEELR